MALVTRRVLNLWYFHDQNSISSAGGSRLGQHRESAATILSSTTRGDSAYGGSVYDTSSPQPQGTGNPEKKIVNEGSVYDVSSPQLLATGDAAKRLQMQNQSMMLYLHNHRAQVTLKKDCK